MVENSLVKSQNKVSFSSFLTSEGVKRKINEIVGGKDGQTFITNIISAVSVNPALADCEHSSILSAAMLGLSLKLSPSPQLGQFYIVPYNDTKNNRKTATFQLGYKGYIQLAIRSGYYKKINVLAIKEGELVLYNPLEELIQMNLIEDDDIRENTPTVGYYAMFEYMNGFKKTIYWSKKKMEAHAIKYSPAYATDKKKGWKMSFWSKDFDSMAFKTMLRQLISKWGIMSVELQEAIEHDTEPLMESSYVDLTPQEPAQEQTPAKKPRKQAQPKPQTDPFDIPPQEEQYIDDPFVSDQKEQPEQPKKDIRQQYVEMLLAASKNPKVKEKILQVRSELFGDVKTEELSVSQLDDILTKSGVM